MRVLNRTAITLAAAEPYLRWTLSHDADVTRGQMTVAGARPYGTAFLLPEFELEEDLREWVEENFAWLFELQLSTWTEDESTWPADRNLKMFREWFRVEIHSTVVDVAEDDIEGEEL